MEDQRKIQEYKGNCHCGAYKFSIKIPEPGLRDLKVRSCDCSICIRNAALWVYPIADKDLVVTSDEDALKVYKFGSDKMIHYFCPTCGSSVEVVALIAPKDQQIAVNARMLKDIDISSLALSKLSGSTYGDPYEGPTFPPQSELEAKFNYERKEGDGMKIYNGNCHCGKVTYSVLTKPLDEQEVMSCNCSLCSRNGDLFIYPPKKNVLVHTGDDHLTGYAFLSPNSLHTFCDVCGISVLVKVLGDGEDDDIRPVNVRTLVGFDEMQEKGLKMQYYDGRAKKPLYEV